MEKKAKIALLASLFMTVMLVVVLASAKIVARDIAACKDGIDNDGDGYIDYPNDPGCSSRNDASELNPDVQCDDGLDNDGDGARDMADGGCTGLADNDESNCGDGICEGSENQLNCQQDCGYPDSCADSDGGLNYGTYGIASGYYNNNQYSYNDYCIDASMVNEYFCSGSYAQSLNNSCGTDSYADNYCMNSSIWHDLTDYYCSAGACSYSITPYLVEECDYGCTNGVCNPPLDSCADTDGGVVFETLGTVYGFISGLPYNSTDLCADNELLMEFACDGVYPTVYNVSCIYANFSMCSDGQCI